MAMREAILWGALVAAAGCAPDLDTTRQVTPRGSFGTIVYQEACQRVAYTSQLDDQAAGLRQSVDVTGALYDPVCLADAPAPSDAPDKLKAMQEQRATLVRVVDLILPQPFLTPLQNFLVAIDVLDDDGTLPDTITTVGTLLGKFIADPGFTPALSRISGRTGFRPTALAGGIVGPVVQYPAIDDLLGSTLNLLLDQTGAPVAELNTMLVALSSELANAQPLADPADPTRTLAVALGFLTTQSLDAAPAMAAPIYLSQRDVRGVPALAGGAVVAPFVDTNKDGLPDIDVHGRFVGANGTALTIGAPFLPPGQDDPAKTTRDANGRLTAGGAPVYSYFLLEGSVLAALLRETGVLANPQNDDLLGLVHGAGGLLGPRLAQTKKYTDAKGDVTATLNYSGFDLTQSSLLDLAHAYIQLLGAPDAKSLLTVGRTLLALHEDPATRAIGAMLDVSDRGKQTQFAAARIPATSTLYDELALIIIRILQVPDLASDLVAALTDPHVLGLAPMLARLFEYDDHFVLDQTAQTVSGTFATLPNRKQPDSDFNRSVMQRLMHLIHDANGVQFCNKQGAEVSIGFIPIASYDACDLFKLDDLGLFFALTIVDRSITDDPSRPETRNEASFREHITSTTMHDLIQDNSGFFGDELIQSLVGIDGFTRFPTPEAAARVLFLDTAHQSSFMQSTSDPVTCSDGDTFIGAHNDTVFAWEQTLPNNPSGMPNDTFYDAVRPLLDAFAKHDECVGPNGAMDCSVRRNAVKIFLDLVSVLHVHWSTAAAQVNGNSFQSSDPAQPRYSTGDGAVTYEPLLTDVMANSDLVPSIIGLAPTLTTMTIDGQVGSPAALPVVLEAARFVFDPALTPPGLAYRDGRTTTTYSDGKTPVPRATPYYLLADAYAGKRLQLAAAPTDRQGAWRAATSDLVNEALTVQVTNGVHQMQNRRLHGVTLALLEFLGARIDAHSVAGDYDMWVEQTLTANLTDSAGGPLMAALVDLTAKLETDTTTLQNVYGLLQSLVSEGTNGSFPTLLAGAADLLQLFLDDTEVTPIARAVGTAVSPSSLSTPLLLMKRARALDPNLPMTGDSAHHTTLTTILRNLFQPVPSQAQPMSDLSDSLAEINRVVAGSASDLDAADYQHVMGQVQSFLTDEQRGFLRFTAIVQNRNLPVPTGN